MTCRMDITQISKGWFNVKEKYLVKINSKTKEASCTCQAGMFKISGRKQKECKHIVACWRLLKCVQKKK